MKPMRNKTPVEADVRGVGPQEQSELEIEKGWLQLTKVDMEKFEFFYKKYRPRIFKYILMRVGDQDLATYLTNETFSRAVDKLDLFTWQGYSFGAWLYKIAFNVVAGDYRQKKSRREVPFEADYHDRDNGERPDQEVERLDDSRILMMCMGRLKPNAKEAFINFYGLGMTTKETGIVMKMAEATVKSHLQRGRKQLRDCLVANGIERGLSRGATKIIRASAAREIGWGVLGVGDVKLPTEDKTKSRKGESGE